MTTEGIIPKLLKKFVVFEGLDGSGTTTQMGLLRENWERKILEGGEKLPPLWTTAEPTQTSSGRLLRKALSGEEKMASGALAELFAADRARHLYGPDGVMKHLADGEIVVSDRYVPSSLVYQGIDCGYNVPLKLNENFPAPELILYFEVEPEEAEKRMAGRGKKEIFEYLEFQKKCRDMYPRALEWCVQRGAKLEVINSHDKLDNIAKIVFSLTLGLTII
jgi:dTMP kinase